MLDGVVAEELLAPFSVKPGRVYGNDIFDQIFGRPDSFPSPRIYEIGFVAPNLVDETEELLGRERIPHTYVTNGYLGIFPDLIDDPDEVVFEIGYYRIPVVVLSWVVDVDLVYGPTVQIVAISPRAPYVDPDIFYSPAFVGPLELGLVVDVDVIRATVIRRDGDAYVLLTEPFDDVDTIYAPLSAKGLAPAIVLVNDVIYAASQIATIQALEFSSDDVVYALSSFNQTQPSRVVADDNIFGSELRTPGRMGLFVDDDIFFISTVQFGNLRAPFVVEADEFTSPVVGELPPIVPYDFIVDFADTYYAPTITIQETLAPFRWVDVDVILSVPAVILGQVWQATFIVDADTFYAPILPPVITSADFAPPDVIFTPVLLFDQLMLPGWHVDNETFQTASMAGKSSFDGTLSMDGPIMPSDPQPTVIYIEG